MWRAVVLCLLGGCEVVFPLGASADADIDAADDGGPVFDGLVARYRLDTVTATLSTPDATGHGHDGECAGDRCATMIAGKHGSALLFDGADDHFRVTPDAAFDLSAAFTIAIWIRLDRKATFDTVLALPYPRSSADAVAFYYDNIFGHAMEFNTNHLVSGTLTSFNLPTALDWPVDEWHHLAGRWDGTRKSLFVDGAEVNFQDPGGPLVVDVTASMAIGTDVDNDLPASYFGGAIDEIQIYGRALADNELLELAK